MSILILVVDDESDVETLFRQHFRRDLKEGRFEMAFAMSGGEALTRIATLPEGLDLILILSDVNMPGMNGLDLLSKSREVKPAVPVIMITAYGDADTRRSSLERGAEDLLVKPVDFAALRARIDAHLSKWTSRGA
jgi:DNA-binding response OmpR family regulator